MRILLDECLPRKLKWSFPEHECTTVQEAGLGGKQNGDLLTLAEGKFDVFLTVDKGALSAEPFWQEDLRHCCPR